MERGVRPITTGRIVSVIVINGLLIVLGLGILELIFGSWIGGTDYGALNIPRTIERRFDVSQLYDRKEAVVYRRDHYGFRGNNGDDPSLIDVLVLGGSTTNEINVSEGETWVDVMTRALHQSGHSLKIVNAAVDGQSTRGHLKAIEVWLSQIPGLRPRWVLAYVGINDLALEYHDQYDAMESPDAFRRFKKYVENHSAIVAVVRKIQGYIRARNADLVHGAGSTLNGKEWIGIPFPDLAPVRISAAKDLSAYDRRLRLLAAAIRDMGAEPIFVTQRFADYRLEDGRLYGIRQPNGSAAAGHYAQITVLNERLLQTCHEIGAVCIDLARHIDLNDDGDFYDLVHTTPQGSRKIGLFLYEALKDVFDVKRPGSSR